MSLAWRKRKRREPNGPRQEPRVVAGTITGISAQAQARSDRLNVQIDGEYAFSLAAEEALHLRVGEQVDAGRVVEMLDRDAAERAYHRALHFLAARPRSAFEVRRRLRAAGVDEPAACQTIERLQQQGLIDDTEFAIYWVEQRQAFKPRGPRALCSELRAKGVAVDAFAAAVEQTAEDQVDAACRAGVREARRHRARSEREFAQALGTFLGRRGFDYSIVRAATTELWLRAQSEVADQT